MSALLSPGRVRDAATERAVARIVADVRRSGDTALVDYARRFDGLDGRIEVGAEEMRAAASTVPARVRRALRQAARHIRAVAARQVPRRWRTRVAPGITVEQRVIALDRVGCYVPGGRYPLPIVRLNDDTWLYEITTEDPVILTGPFTVRYPMRHDANYFTPEYACHEDNTIVRNYVNTSRHERANPTPEPPQPPVQVAAGVADALAGRWVGRPRIATIDVDVELEFTKNADGTVNGKLIGTNLGAINRPLRGFTIVDKTMYFTLPNVDPWRFSGDIRDGGTIDGVVASAQGGVPVTFRRVAR